MALCSLRFRRALTLSSSLINHHRPFSSIPAITASASLSSLFLNSQNHGLDPSLPRLLGLPFQSRPFRSSTVSLGPPRSSFNNDNSEIGPDTILFEGCDYNHWLITMDFPDDPKPTPEEMVETYVQTLAKVVGSVEEAKKRMYACSTTTYTGFQAEMSEEMSEKFRDLPGVVFILPDSYIDPVNKEYGGDKYINGTIIPRPPPVQFGRQGGRYGDRNRDYNRRSRGPAPYQQGNSAYDKQTYGAQQNFTPQQNYGPAGPGERRGPMPLNNAPVGRDTYQGDRRDPVPSYQANYNQGGQGNYSPQGQRDFPPGNQRDYVPPEQRDFQGDYRNYAPPQGGNNGQGASGTHVQGASGTNGQGVGGSHGQMGAGYGQSYLRQGGDQRFSQLEQRNNMQGEQRNYAATGHTGTDQGKY